jgi:vacuolar iron transporter family protein
LLNMDSQSGLGPEASGILEEKHPHIPARHVLDKIVLGASDGAIEAVAMTTALNGAKVGFGTIVLAGIAFAVAGAVSMFSSTYLSRRSELDFLKIDVEREKMEIETEPEEERAELEQLLKKDGYDQAEVDVIMGRLLKNKELWLREQLARELKLHIEDLSANTYSEPISAGLAFLALAMLAVSPYAAPLGSLPALGVSLGASLVALFILGSRAFIPRNFRLRGGLESALVCAMAAGLMYFVGDLLSKL